MKLKYILIFCLLSTFAQADNVNFWVALPSANTLIMERWAREIADPTSFYYGQYMTVEEINDVTKPPRSVSEPVLEWLRDSGIDTVLHGDSISCSGTVEDVEALLSVDIYYHHERKHFHSHDRYNVPDHLNDKILFIDGISNPLLPGLKVHKTRQPGGGYQFYVAREVVNRLYNLNDPTLRHNSSAGAAEFKDANGFSYSAIRTVQQVNDIIVDSDIVVVGENTFNLSTETNLDLQMLAQTLQLEDGEIWYWGAASWMYSFAASFMQTADVPQVISMSWGWAEDEQCTIAPCNDEDAQQYIDRTNVEFMKIALRGITLLAASGDAGAPGRTAESCIPDRPINPVFPGSSPWLTSVGGTYISDNIVPLNNSFWKTPFCREYGCATGNTQRPCTYEATQWTTGGGFGIYPSEELPPWQQEAVATYLVSGVPMPPMNNFNFAGRGYPDVAMNGNYCPTWLIEGLIPVGGTSCAAPLFGAMVALINDHQVARGRPRVGYFNPLLYLMWGQEPGTFHDITEGNNWCTEMECCPTNPTGGSNYGFQATKGWDPVSGVGYPNMGQIFRWLDANT